MLLKFVGALAEHEVQVIGAFVAAVAKDVEPVGVAIGGVEIHRNVQDLYGCADPSIFEIKSRILFCAIQGVCPSINWLARSRPI